MEVAVLRARASAAAMCACASIARIRRALRSALRVTALLAVALSPPATLAATLPAGFAETLVASGLVRPTAMAFAPDGRLFVTLQDGAVRVVKDGLLLPAPFVKLAVAASGETGLLGIAFDPAFASNRYVYLHYTVPATTRFNRVSRFVADGDTAVAGSETVVFGTGALDETFHVGGALHFGPDGKLYIGVGDNGYSPNAQNAFNLFGKLLRIDSDGGIPTDNPFYRFFSGDNRAIWAYGLRNPFTFAFQRGTGRMLINDVGALFWEEIDEGKAGANYGWPVSEGATNLAGVTPPVYTYGHGDGDFLGCAITGGTFYDPPVQALPASYNGAYFFADYCGNWINVLDLAQGNAVSAFATGVDSPIGLEVGPDGQLYYLSRGGVLGGGAIYRIDAPGMRAPTGAITSPPEGALYAAGDTIAYAGTATDPQDGTLAPGRFTWQVDQYLSVFPVRTVPVVPPTTGVAGGTFVVPTTSEASPDAFYRITLTVVDSEGLVHLSHRDILPRTATLTLTTDPPGLPVTLDGIAHTTPFSFRSVVGMRRTIGVATPQAAAGASYAFAEWSTGGRATHVVATPPEDTTYTARFGTRARR